MSFLGTIVARVGVFEAPCVAGGRVANSWATDLCFDVSLFGGVGYTAIFHAAFMVMALLLRRAFKAVSVSRLDVVAACLRFRVLRFCVLCCVCVDFSIFALLRYCFCQRASGEYGRKSVLAEPLLHLFTIGSPFFLLLG